MEAPESNLLQQLLFNSDNALDTLFAKVPSEMSIELAENLYDYFLKFGKLEVFLRWIIKKEVGATKTFGELFREERLGVKIIQRTMYDDENMKCLKNFLKPLLKSIKKHDKPIQLNTPDLSRLLQDVKFITKCLESFVENFGLCVNTCSKNLRRLFSMIHKSVVSKFPDGESFILSFIMFHYFCPVLVDPKKYGLVKKSLPKNAKASLIIASKLLNDLALNSTEKQKHPLLVEFIQKERPNIMKAVLIMIDESDIERFPKQTHLGKSSSYSENDRMMSSKTLQKLLDDISGLTLSNKVEVLLDSPEMFDLKWKQFFDKLHNTNWKKVEDKKKVAIYTLKQDDIRALAVKSVTVIEATKETIKETFYKIRFDKEWNAVVESHWFLKLSERYEEVVMVNILPFPLANRDVALSLWNYYSENRIAMVNESLPLSIYPKQIGFIRSYSYLGGWDIVEDASNPRRCTVTYMTNAHLGGSIPMWFTNVGMRIEARKITLLAQYCEQAQKLKDN